MIIMENEKLINPIPKIEEEIAGNEIILNKGIQYQGQIEKKIKKMKNQLNLQKDILESLKQGHLSIEGLKLLLNLNILGIDLEYCQKWHQEEKKILQEQRKIVYQKSILGLFITIFSSIPMILSQLPNEINLWPQENPEKALMLCTFLGALYTLKTLKSADQLDEDWKDILALSQELEKYEMKSAKRKKEI